MERTQIQRPPSFPSFTFSPSFSPSPINLPHSFDLPAIDSANAPMLEPVINSIVVIPASNSLKIQLRTSTATSESSPNVATAFSALISSVGMMSTPENFPIRASVIMEMVEEWVVVCRRACFGVMLGTPLPAAAESSELMAERRRCEKRALAAQKAEGLAGL